MGAEVNVIGIACKLFNISSVARIHSPPSIDKLSKFLKFFKEKAFNAFDHIIFPSEACKNQWIKAVKIYNEKFSRVWNGVETECSFLDFSKRKRSKEEKFCLISVGRLISWKGFEYLIEAVHEVNDERLELSILGAVP
jgi:glycosyltransferase involved in cell wall biosynthesis